MSQVDLLINNGFIKSTEVDSIKKIHGLTANAVTPGFDCSKAKSIPEYLICHDPELAASDRDLASVYQLAKVAALDKTAFAERTRKQWNYREKNCHDKECLVAWYAYQKNVLTKIA
jgi:uncharacterized protein